MAGRGRAVLTHPRPGCSLGSGPHHSVHCDQEALLVTQAHIPLLHLVGWDPITSHQTQGDTAPGCAEASTRYYLEDTKSPLDSESIQAVWTDSQDSPERISDIV